EYYDILFHVLPSLLFDKSQKETFSSSVLLVFSAQQSTIHQFPLSNLHFLQTIDISLISPLESPRWLTWWHFYQQGFVLIHHFHKSPTSPFHCTHPFSQP